MKYLEKTRLAVLTLAIGLGLSAQDAPSAERLEDSAVSTMGLHLTAPLVKIESLDPVVCCDQHPRRLLGGMGLELGRFLPVPQAMPFG